MFVTLSQETNPSIGQWIWEAARELALTPSGRSQECSALGKEGMTGTAQAAEATVQARSRGLSVMRAKSAALFSLSQINNDQSAKLP